MASRAALKRAEGEREIVKLGYHTAGVATNILFSKIASLVITGVAFVFVSRLLGPVTYGVYVLATAFAGVFISFGGLGVSTALPKFIAEYKSRRKMEKVADVVSSGYIAIIATGIALTLIAIAFGGPISQFVFKGPSYYYIVVVASVSITLSLLYDASYAALVGFGRKGFLVKLSLVQVTVQSLVSIALVLLGFGAYGPIIGFIVGLGTGTLVATTSIYTKEGLVFRLPTRKSMAALLAFALPIGVYTAIASAVSNAASLVLGFFASKAIVGNVGVALKIGSVMSLAVDSVGIALLPLFASLTNRQHLKHTNTLYNYSVYLMLAMLIPVIASLCVLSWNITVILWPSWTSLPYLVPIVSIGVIFTMLYTYTATILISKNKVRELMKYSLAVSVLEFALLLALIPYLKGIGLVVVASLITPVVSFVLYIRLAGRLIGLRLDYRKIVRIVVASLLIAAVIAPLTFLFSHSSITVLALATALVLLVYPPLVLKLGGLSVSDLEIIKGMSKTMPIVGLLLSGLADYALRYNK
ncbi:MAG: polysaccharide biosynthesis C-terminal domain-containing protein [Candidatus Micrarchaeota archaeon]|nr:polysaccharide biosynthesis C-terminal domain-containing protein [Candidatus Micrarchaeota archaeon]